MTETVDFFQTRDDLSIRFGRWVAQREKGRGQKGSVILLGGRAEFLEKYLETIHELNQRGFDVYSMDWRGQGLSSRMLPDRRKGFVKTYEDYLDDLNRFITGIVCPQALSPLIILGHSMGAHIALRYVHDFPGTIERMVLLSPMIDIVTPPLPNWFISGFVHGMVKMGFSHGYALGAGEYDLSREPFNGNRYTSDPQRFDKNKKMVAEHPELAIGGVTYGWVSATLSSIDILVGNGYANRIEIPVLMVSAGADRIVSLKAIEKICGRIPASRFVMIPDSRHEILQENNAIRSAFWVQFDTFIKQIQMVI